jgi:hypothetical protein
MTQMYMRGAFIEVLGIRFAGRIHFTVEKTSEGNPNSAKISLYNLAKETRDRLEQATGIDSANPTGVPVLLAVGYGEDIGPLFTSNIDKIVSERQGPDIITHLDTAEGRGHFNTEVQASFDGPVSGDTLMGIFAGQMGLSEGSVDHDGLAGLNFQNGFSYAGPGSKALDNITKSSGHEWSIQNGTLQVLPENGCTNEDTVLLRKDTGLIGVPSRSIDNANRSTFLAVSLLNRLLDPGRKIRVESAELSQPADLVVRKVTHEGDTQEGPWQSTIEALLPVAA